ncbi:hypothetical protein [Sphingomonas sp. LHG3443-2]|uniref:hypothetical protein n=1 Tax=Sphingomonas sp. LHG3443-2 TaxID=2804639 RepID=UPI003CEEC883
MSLLLAALAMQAADPSAIVGLCRFDVAQLSFAGTPAEQARCLMQPVGKRGALAASPKRLPGTLSRVMEGRIPLPSRDAVAQLLTAERMDIGSLDQPVSRARDGDPAAPLARYFVIHDTSTPFYGDEPFPADIDGDARVNSFAPYFPASADPEKFPVAHLFLNRIGQVLVGQPLCGHGARPSSRRE